MACINDILSSEILQNIFLLSAESFSDVLRISVTCKLWRKLIFDSFVIAHYWKFDNEHRRQGLLQWWNFEGHTTDQLNPFIKCPITDCFLGKCISVTNANESSENIPVEIPEITIDRGSNYTIALWIKITEIGNYCFSFFQLNLSVF